VKKYVESLRARGVPEGGVRDEKTLKLAGKGRGRKGPAPDRGGGKNLLLQPPKQNAWRGE